MLSPDPKQICTVASYQHTKNKGARFYFFHLKLPSYYNCTTCMLKVYYLPIYVCFIKLGKVFAIWKIPPATHSNSKQIIQFQYPWLWCLPFPFLRLPASCYKLLIGHTGQWGEGHTTMITPGISLLSVNSFLKITLLFCLAYFVPCTSNIKIM